MFKICEVNDREWDSFIKEIGCNDIYYDRAYYSALSEYVNSPIFLLAYKNGSAAICKVVQVNDISDFKYFSGKIPSGKYYDLETPYGYGGTYSQNATAEDEKEFFEEVNKWANENNIVSEFIRYNPLLENQNLNDSKTKVIRMKSTVAIDLTQDDLFQELSSKNRNMVRKAIKSGVKIEAQNLQNQDVLKTEFMRLYKETMDRNNAEDFYHFTEEYFSQFFKDMHGKYFILSAKYEDKIIATSIFMFDDKNMHYYLSGADRNYMNLAPNNLLLYKAAEIGKEMGLKSFHLGGGVSDNDALFSFKKSFNQNGILDFYIGRVVYNEKIFQKLVEIRSKSPNFEMDKPFLIKYRQEEVDDKESIYNCRSGR